MMGPPVPSNFMQQVDPAEEEKRRLIMQLTGMQQQQQQPQPQPQPQLQPPAPPPQPIAPDATLGQVNQVANGPSNIEQIFQQAQELAARAYAPALRQPKGGEQKGLAWHLGNAASFGMMGLAEHDYNAKYNQIVEHDNQAIRLHAAKEAFDLTKEAAGIGQMGLKQQLAMANFQARLAGLNLQQQRFELDKLRASMGIEEAGSSPMPTAEQADTARQLYGQEWTPDPRLGGGKGHYGPVKRTSPGYNPPAEGTPLAGALGGGEKKTPDQLLQERRQQIADEKKKQQEEKTVLPTAATRTMAEKGPKVLKLVQMVQQDLDKINAGPLRSRWREFKTGTLGVADPTFMRYSTNAGLLQTALMQMHTGARGSKEMLEKFKHMINSGIQAPENMQAALDAISEYAKSVSNPSGTSLPGTKSTAPSAPTSLDDLLKKHGY
jgi:hypothetical protein